MLIIGLQGAFGIAKKSGESMSVDWKRRALITGASSGIGKATALAFAKAGINVALVSRSLDKLEAVAEAARHTGTEATVYAVDLANILGQKQQSTL